MGRLRRTTGINVAVSRAELRDPRITEMAPLGRNDDLFGPLTPSFYVCLIVQLFELSVLS